MVTTFQRASEFVPAGLDGTRLDQLEPLYQALLGREPRSAPDLERLILDRSELDAAASEAGSLLYIAMTCHTDDPAATAAYLAFVEHVQPRLKQLGFELDRRIAASPFAFGLDQARYAVYLRELRTAIELFRAENIPLETELARLDQEFSQIAGAMTVTFRGEELPLPRMARFQEETDRATREEAWRLVAQRRLRDRDALDDLYDRMLALRQRIAVNAGFPDFRAYAFRLRRRYDYTPADCDDFARGIEQVVVPALRDLHARRAERLGIDRLRPWDVAVDTLGRPPLRPFQSHDDLVAGTTRMFHRLDGRLAAMFESLQGGGRLDLDSRKGKAPGGYQASLDRRREPFIFMNAAGVARDVEVMVHEAGHAFHSLLSRRDPVLFYRSEIPLEFAEVASMSMELLTHPFLDEFYPPADADRARRVHLEAMTASLPWIATIDQFQHWVYTHPGHSRDDRRRAWVEISTRFTPTIDWSGLGDAQGWAWQRQLHLFGAPFYYIEYGIAQLGALQLWAVFQRDPARAVDAYVRALELGGSRPLPDLFRAAGLEFNFTPDMIRRVWTTVERSLASLPA